MYLEDSGADEKRRLGRENEGHANFRLQYSHEGSGNEKAHIAVTGLAPNTALCIVYLVFFFSQRAVA